MQKLIRDEKGDKYYVIVDRNNEDKVLWDYFYTDERIWNIPCAIAAYYNGYSPEVLGN